MSEGGQILCEARRVPQNTNIVVVLTPAFGATGDVNCDGAVNRDDLLEVIRDWNESESIADVNHDGTVNVSDLLLVIVNWTR